MLDLHKIEFRETSYPGVGIAFLRSDRASGYAAVLIRMEPGCSYPRHRHKGFEEIFVLEGAFSDELGTYGEGESLRYEDGSVHGPFVPEDGDTCIFYAISQEGIDLLDQA